MTEQQQRIAIAEACGWKWEPPANLIHPSKEKWWRPLPNHSDEIIREMTFDLPDFLRDLNAMWEAENTLSRKEVALYDDYLNTILPNKTPITVTIFLWHATAAQRAEAFLRTKGLWIDK